eukprot:7390203-Prymnesium_polylepis.2
MVSAQRIAQEKSTHAFVCCPVVASYRLWRCMCTWRAESGCEPCGEGPSGCAKKASSVCAASEIVSMYRSSLTVIIML